MATHRRPGRTCYSPLALIFGLDGRLTTGGLDHCLERPYDAALTRFYVINTRSRLCRKLAMHTVVGLDHSDMWNEAVRCPYRPLEATYYLPDEPVCFWKRCLHARLKHGNETMREFKNSLSSRQTERRHACAAVFGHEYDNASSEAHTGSHVVERVRWLQAYIYDRQR